MEVQELYEDSTDEVRQPARFVDSLQGKKNAIFVQRNYKLSLSIKTQSSKQDDVVNF